MLTKKMTYVDFNGVERTEEFYFNLTRAEVMKMETSVDGGLAEKIQRIVDIKDGNEIMKIFHDFILAAYGEKSPDGRHFVKSEEISKAFEQTQAYSDLFWELATDPVAASAFIEAVLPTIVEDTKTN